jgi:hypothetical protein
MIIPKIFSLYYIKNLSSYSKNYLNILKLTLYKYIGINDEKILKDIIIEIINFIKDNYYKCDSSILNFLYLLLITKR